MAKNMNLHQRTMAFRKRFKRDIWTSEYISFRLGCLRRDKFTCQDCGCTDRTILNVHHKKQWINNKDKRFSCKNGITLCKNCHSKIHPWMKKDLSYDLDSVQTGAIADSGTLERLAQTSA